MIPDLPHSVTDMERLEFYDKILGNLENQSVLHETWHTHKANPSVCWICDLMSISRKVLYITEQYISKSAVDSETSISSGEDSELESDDEFFNKNEENIPEYDTVDDSNEEEKL